MLSTTHAIRLTAVKIQQAMPYSHTNYLTIMQLHSLLFALSQAQKFRHCTGRQQDADVQAL